TIRPAGGAERRRHAGAAPADASGDADLEPHPRRVGALHAPAPAEVRDEHEAEPGGAIRGRLRPGWREGRPGGLDLGADRSSSVRETEGHHPALGHAAVAD